MTRRVRIQPLAHDDLMRQTEYIAKDNLQAALRLSIAAEDTFSFLTSTPLAGQPCGFTREDAKDLRIHAIRGFRNYLIIYQATEDEVIIVRVLHAAQDRDGLFGYQE